MPDPTSLERYRQRRTSVIRPGAAPVDTDVPVPIARVSLAAAIGRDSIIVPPRRRRPPRLAR
jgi:hypothetical protein